MTTSGNTTTIRHNAIIAKLIGDCYDEQDIDKRIQILYEIKSLLPESCRINIPSLITNDYIYSALYKIEENIQGIIASACTEPINILKPH